MKNTKSLHGFKLIHEEYLKDIDSTAKIFLHEKSHARLLSLENDDDNKSFGIGFRTPPKNSTGVAHILEHTVLNGSRKFKTREPFMDLLKGSLQTFLNAMTFSDKTIYPIASRNLKDFHNLMDVYLDAVFFPKIYDTKEIFLQEGWHYEIFEKDEDIRYKGVVYNEMRGAYSSPNSVMYHEFAKGLFPDTIYGNESGGEPYTIPELSYEEFLDFHRKFYHPSNSYIYLYGNIDLEKELEFINDEYLQNFDYIEVDSSIETQTPFKEKRVLETEYSLATGEDAENKDYLIYGTRTCEKSDLLEAYTNDILLNVLFSDDSAPVKLALLEKGIGEDIVDISTDGKEVGFGIAAVNTSRDKLEEFNDIIEETLRKVIKEGIDKDHLLATINRKAFSLKENNNFPTPGVIYMIQALDTWLYDEDPLIQFRYENLLDELKEKVDTDYYERYVEEKFLNNNHKVLMSLNASPGLNNKKDEKVKEKLKAYKESLTDKELEDLIEENKKLQAFQNREDTLEEKNTIPKLELSDVNTDLKDIPIKKKEIDNIKLYHSPLFTKKINYIHVLFDVEFMEKEDIPYMSLLNDVLGLMDTENYDYKEISTLSKLYTGSIYTALSTWADFTKEVPFKKKVFISSKSTIDNTEKMFEIIEEIVVRTKFENKKRFKEILQKIKLRMENSVLENGNSYAMLRNSSYYTERGAFNELANGLSYYDFIVDILNNFDEKSEIVLDKLKALSEDTFTKKNTIFHVTTDEEDYPRVEKAGLDFINNLKEKNLPENKITFDLKPNKEGIMTSANINYVVKGGNLNKYGYEYAGVYQVLSNILSSEYLYNNIRAQGGAYGTGISINKSGNMILMSYRDPNLEKTLETYDNLPEYLNNLDLSKEELDQYIIGSVSKFDPPMTSAVKGSTILDMQISGNTMENVRKGLKEALNCTVDDLRKFAPMAEKALKEDNITVIGIKESIKNNEDMFNTIRDLK